VEDFILARSPNLFEETARHGFRGGLVFEGHGKVFVGRLLGMSGL
jgi:hypothetical protein